MLLSQFFVVHISFDSTYSELPLLLYQSRFVFVYLLFISKMKTLGRLFLLLMWAGGVSGRRPFSLSSRFRKANVAGVPHRIHIRGGAIEAADAVIGAVVSHSLRLKKADATSVSDWIHIRGGAVDVAGAAGGVVVVFTLLFGGYQAFINLKTELNKNYETVNKNYDTLSKNYDYFRTEVAAGNNALRAENNAVRTDYYQALSALKTDLSKNYDTLSNNYDTFRTEVRSEFKSLNNAINSNMAFRLGRLEGVVKYNSENGTNLC